MSEETQAFGGDYYRLKGKECLAIRIKPEVQRWFKIKARESSLPYYTMIEDVLSNREVDKITPSASYDGKKIWMTYVNSELHREIKIESLKKDMNLKDVAGLVLERHYDESTKGSKKNSTEKGQKHTQALTHKKEATKKEQKFSK